MRIFLLFALTFGFINLSFSQSGNGHTQTTTLSYNPTGFSASNMLGTQKVSGAELLEFETFVVISTRVIRKTSEN